LIPLGNPLIVTLTTLENPFTAFNVTVTGALVPPTFVETDAGVMTTLKSATGGGGGGELPHAFRRHKLPMKMMNNRNCFTVSSNVRRFWGYSAPSGPACYAERAQSRAPH
jgi:hypothetical protein